MGHHDEAKLDVKFIDFARQMNLYLNHFPRHEKYGLCQQIRNSAYEVYGLIVESQKRYMKKTSLTNLDIAHEQLRMFIRLAFELGYFKFKDGAQCAEKEFEKTAAHRYLVISRMVDELGRMIGGWVNSCAAMTGVQRVGNGNFKRFASPDSGNESSVFDARFFSPLLQRQRQPKRAVNHEAGPIFIKLCGGLNRPFYGPTELFNSLPNGIVVESNAHGKLRKRAGTVFVSKHLFTDWIQQIVLSPPKFINPAKNHLARNVRDFCPLGKSLGISVDSNKPAGSPVVGLLNYKRPPTVSRAVSEFIVNSLNGMRLGWLLPHVVQKIDKRQIPPLAHRNSATTVAFVARGIFVFTPLAHPAPSVVFGRFTKSVKFSFFNFFHKVYYA